MAPKVVLITGSSSGIGLATAKLLASYPDGYKVVATARKPSAIESIAKEHKFDVQQLDVTDSSSVQKAVEHVIEQHGRLDVLINNAGYGTYTAVEQMGFEDHKALFETNYFGMVRMIQAVLPHMRAARSGHIINVTSLAGIQGFPGADAYSASKFAVEGLSESMAPLLSAFGIRVSLVEPGPVTTEFQNRVQKDIDAAGGPKKDVYTPLIDAFFGNIRKTFAETPGVTQTSQDIADLMKKVIEDSQPHLRYQTSDFVESAAKRKFVDPTGDSIVRENLKFLEAN